MAMTETVQVEVALALPERQELVVLQVAAGTTARQAVELSGLLARCPQLEPDSLKLGIFGKAVKDDAVLREHDRVEIYRPLIADPKTVRRERAEAGKRMKKAAVTSRRREKSKRRSGLITAAPSATAVVPPRSAPGSCR